MRQNYFPGWVNGLILGVVLLGVLLALPNAFGEDPAIQIAPDDGSTVAPEVAGQVEQFLDAEGLAYDRVRELGGAVMVTFASTGDQVDAVAPLRAEFQDGYTTALTALPRLPDALRALGLRPMALGLDLRGGVRFVFEVDLASATAKYVEQAESGFRAALREPPDGAEGIRSLGSTVDDTTITFTFNSSEAAVAAERVMRRTNEEFEYLRRPAGGARYEVSAIMTEEAIEALQARAIEQNLTTLRRRVDALGAAEPVIQQQGLNRIVVELPGVQDPLLAERLIGATATVEFRLNDTENDAARVAETGRAPFGSRLYYHRDGFPVLLRRNVIASGDNLTNASYNPTTADGRGPAVSVTLDSQAGARMARATQQNLGKPMSVVYIESRRVQVENEDGEIEEQTVEDAKVISIATIQGVFSNQFQITGLNPAEADELATLLRSGSLAAPIFKVQESTIGPSLGKENITRGQRAILLGFLAVVVFMAVYYRVFGLFADAALLVNLILIVALLSVLPAALSLPGIAGIVLTVGMSVDANVLIFERIREEIRSGNSPQASIHAGYEKALSTIADANITTAIAALILGVFGTGPVRGFAVTLMIGIVTSMFTAIIVTRALVNLYYGRRQVSSLAI